MNTNNRKRIVYIRYKERHLLRLVTFFIGWAFLNIGCTPGPVIVLEQDISSDKKLWYGYNQNEKYILNCDVFLRKFIDDPDPVKTVLVAPREKTRGICNLLYSAPFSINQYKKSLEKWPDVEGIVGEGTVIQCTRLIKYIPVGHDSSIYIYATILEGPFKGTEAEISDLSISEEKNGLYLMKPNVEILTEIVHKR